MSDIDKKISQIQPGGILKLGERTWIERSGDGTTLRFVRREGNSEKVIRTWRF